MSHAVMLSQNVKKLPDTQYGAFHGFREETVSSLYQIHFKRVTEIKEIIVSTGE